MSGVWVFIALETCDVCASLMVIHVRRRGAGGPSSGAGAGPSACGAAQGRGTLRGRGREAPGGCLPQAGVATAALCPKPPGAHSPGCPEQLLVRHVAGEHGPAPQVHEPRQFEDVERGETRGEEGPHPGADRGDQ